MHKLRAVAPILIDTNIILFGVDRETTDPRYAFPTLKTALLDPLFSFLQNALIHESAYFELPPLRQDYVDSLPNLRRVDTNSTLYGNDPSYTCLLNEIARHPEFSYPLSTGQWNSEPVRKNRADIFMLAYAGHHGIPFLCSKDQTILSVANSVASLSSIHTVLGAEAVALASDFHSSNQDIAKMLKALYKEFSAPEIRRGDLPPNLGLYKSEIQPQLP